MEIRDLALWLNLALAFFAVPPAFFLMSVLMRERKIIDHDQIKLNRTLVLLFGGVSIATIINSAISAIAIFLDGYYAHALSPFRSVFINAFFTFISWLLYGVYKQIVKK